jgi:hypothetical protein
MDFYAVVEYALTLLRSQTASKFPLRIWLVKPTLSAHRHSAKSRTLPFHRESLILPLYGPEWYVRESCPRM